MTTETDEARIRAQWQRRRHAEVAYDRALAPARLPLHDPARMPYPEAVAVALAAYDRINKGGKVSERATLPETLQGPTVPR